MTEQTTPEVPPWYALREAMKGCSSGIFVLCFAERHHFETETLWRLTQSAIDDLIRGYNLAAQALGEKELPTDRDQLRSVMEKS